MLTLQQPLPSLLLIAISIIVAVYALTRWQFRHLRPTAATGALLLWCGAFWMLTNALEMASTDLSTAAFWNRVQYFGIVPVPTLWLYMALQFTGRQQLLARPRAVLLSVIPAIGLVMALTDDYHHLFMSNVRLVTAGGFSSIVGEPGPVLIIIYLYGYLQITAGTYLLTQRLLLSRGFRWQGSVVLLCVAASIGANILDWSRLSPLPYVKLTPIALAISIPLFVVTLLRARRADIIPIARSSIVQLMQDAVLVLDVENRVIDLNPVAEGIVGRPLTEVLGELIDEVWPNWSREISGLLQTPQGRQEIRLDVGAQQRVFDIMESSLNSRRGDLIGRVVALRDITDRVRAEEAVRLSEEHFRALTENASDIVVIIDREGVIKYASPSIEREPGVRVSEIAGRSSSELVHPDDLNAVVTALHELVQNPGVAAPIAARFRRQDDQWRVIECIANNLLEHPAVKGIVVNARDVTERIRAEEQLKASLAEKEVLLKEIHHRVKNNLQIISSLLSLQLVNFQDPRVLAQFEESQNRIRSMALIHEHLYRSDDLAHIDFGTYLRDLTSSLVQTYRDQTPGVTLQVEADPVWLDIDTAIPCGLLVNELVSNALKHAFPDGRSGAIGVEMSRSGEGQYRLVVWDDGVGFPAGVDYRMTTSLGLQLVNSLARQLNGSVALERASRTRFAIEFPTTASWKE